MGAAVQIELAGEPRGKGRPRFSRKSGVAYTPAETRNYEAALRIAAQDAMAGRAPLEGPLSVTVAVYVPIPASWSKKRRAQAAAGQIRPTTRPDYDNYLKMLDALNTVVWHDDSQVVSQGFAKVYSDRPRFSVSVEQAGVTL
jgi:Holliday junction resolvase RusA-like endonuclease